jgi:3-oxoadipate CoA-transferase, alpha subunit
MIDKIVQSMADAMAGIKDGSTVLVGGFGAVGQPNALIDGLIEQGATDLVVACNNAGVGHVGLARLMELGRVRKIICSFPRSSDPVVFETLYRAGKIELEIVPQGTLAERMRAGGAGIPGFYTRTGVGTDVANGKEVREFDGHQYLLERAINADLALVKAWKADTHGNLVYRRTARNFNPNAATCGRVTVAEAEIIVQPGDLDPDEIHTPGIFVQRLVHNPHPEKRIERRTTRKD